MSYHQPNNNIIVDDVLVIPSFQQMDRYFSFKSEPRKMGTMMVVTNNLDVIKTLDENTLGPLQALAKVLHIKGISKLKKPELVAAITPRICFE